MSKEDLLAEVRDLEAKLNAKREELNAIWREEGKVYEERIASANRGNGDFKLDELRFAAKDRCACGAGMAYPKDYMNPKGDWYCSAILRGVADREKRHTAPLSFLYYEIKSEDQPSAEGATTRPAGGTE